MLTCRLSQRLSVVTGALLLLSASAWGQTQKDACDLNFDGVDNSADVTLAVNMDIGLATCTANIVGPSTCNVVVVQRVIDAALGGPCVTSSGQSMPGPLIASARNPRYFQDQNGNIAFLSGSQTWRTFQDTDQSADPMTNSALDFTAYVNFLKSHGHTATILWRKDLPQYCGWGAGGTWNMAPWPWPRNGPGNATDGLSRFDLSQFNQAYFDRLRSRVIQLNQNGIWAIVELFDGLGLTNNRCSTDGYPLTGSNNINGVDDGGGTNSMTMSAPNTITSYQDAYVKQVIDTLNDQTNVLWEISEEAPDNSTWWQSHMIGLIHAYERGGTWDGTTYPAKPLQHPVGFPTLNVSGANDQTLYNSNADWIAPVAKIALTNDCGSSGTPLCKVVINDSDHTYFGMWNDSAQTNRQFIWENVTNGNQTLFMDPYDILWTSGNRNVCTGATNGVCKTLVNGAPIDTRWDNFRNNLGWAATWAKKLDLVKATPQPNLSSTGYCLAQTPAVGAEYLIYAPNGASFTVNLSSMSSTRSLTVTWLNPVDGSTVSGGTIQAGSSSTSFTTPANFGADALLYLVDTAGHA
jgi:hypothetical protein